LPTSLVWSIASTCQRIQNGVSQLDVLNVAKILFILQFPFSLSFSWNRTNSNKISRNQAVQFNK
jgi:hypothetical protein